MIEARKRRRKIENTEQRLAYRAADLLAARTVKSQQLSEGVKRGSEAKVGTPRPRRAIVGLLIILHGTDLPSGRLFALKRGRNHRHLSNASVANLTIFMPSGTTNDQTLIALADHR